MSGELQEAGNKAFSGEALAKILQQEGAESGEALESAAESFLFAARNLRRTPEGTIFLTDRVVTSKGPEGNFDTKLIKRGDERYVVIDATFTSSVSNRSKRAQSKQQPTIPMAAESDTLTREVVPITSAEADELLNQA